MDDYSDLFSQHEPDPLLRELNGNILWYWKPMNPNDKRMGCVSNAPFEAVDRIKELEAALREIIESARLVGDYHHVKIARAALEGGK
jgi:hypothetical protein